MDTIVDKRETEYFVLFCWFKIVAWPSHRKLENSKTVLKQRRVIGCGTGCVRE